MQVTPINPDHIVSSADRDDTGRFPAFIGLARHTGGVYAEDQAGVTVEEALVAAGLDFDVELHTGVQVPVLTPDGVSTVDFPGHRATVRRNPDGSRSHLGIVRSKYRPAQNRDVLTLGQTIIDEGGANVVAVGGYGDPVGTKTYVALRLPETMLVGGQDRHDLYMSIINSHDGTGGVTALLAPIRFACTNQTYGTFRLTDMRLTLRHTGDVTGKVHEARTLLGLTHRWMPEFEAEMARWLDTPVSEARFEDLITSVLAEPTGTTVRSTNGYEAKRDSLRGLFATAETNAFGRGTAYAAYNAFTEFADFAQPVRNDAQATNRYARIMAGGMDRIKADAQAAVRALVHA
jgi:phage/plasmid-like protein (TIGR03299 family)